MSHPDRLSLDAHEALRWDLHPEAEAAMDRAAQLGHCMILPPIQWRIVTQAPIAPRASVARDPMRLISGRPEMEPGFRGVPELTGDLVRRIKAELTQDAPLESTLVGLLPAAQSDDDELDEHGIDNTLMGLRTRADEARVSVVTSPGRGSGSSPA